MRHPRICRRHRPICLVDVEVSDHVWWAVATAAEPTQLDADTAELVERCVRAALDADRAGPLA